MFSRVDCKSVQFQTLGAIGPEQEDKRRWVLPVYTVSCLKAAIHSQSVKLSDFTE